MHTNPECHPHFLDTYRLMNVSGLQQLRLRLFLCLDLWCSLKCDVPLVWGMGTATSLAIRLGACSIRQRNGHMQVCRADVVSELRQHGRDLTAMMRLMVEHLHDPEPASDSAQQSIATVGIGRRRLEPLNRDGARPLQNCPVHFFSAMAQLIEVFIEIANAEE